jgi:hypothetical protein
LVICIVHHAPHISELVALIIWHVGVADRAVRILLLSFKLAMASLIWRSITRELPPAEATMLIHSTIRSAGSWIPILNCRPAGLQVQRHPPPSPVVDKYGNYYHMLGISRLITSLVSAAINRPLFTILYLPSPISCSSAAACSWSAQTEHNDCHYSHYHSFYCVETQRI